MLNQLNRNSISNEIVTCATLIKVLTLRAFKEHNFEITPEQFIILDAIINNEEIYQRKLGKILGKDRANITRLLDILFKKGLIEKESSSNGRKINKIKITKKGEDLRNKIFPVISKVRQSYLNGIEYKDIENCLKILNKIKENISENTKLQT